MSQKYRGKWLALKADRKTVVGSGKTVEQALAAAKQNGQVNPVLTRMPSAIRSFVGLQRTS